MRKSADLDLVDRIRVTYFAEDLLADAIETHADLIRRETLALELQYSEQPSGGYLETFEINGSQLVVEFSVVKAA